MLKRIIEGQLSKFETEWDYSMDYMREVLALGPGVLARFHKATELGEYCEGVSPAAALGAKLVGVMAGDCGPCVQLVADMGLRQGVPPEAIVAVLEGRFEDLPEDMRLPVEFARALVSRTDDLPELRERMRETHGSAGLVTVAYCVINAGMYPTLKYALGHGHACEKVKVGEALVIPGAPLASEVA
jgi:hypothetical protein